MSVIILAMLLLVINVETGFMSSTWGLSLDSCMGTVCVHVHIDSVWITLLC